MKSFVIFGSRDIHRINDKIFDKDYVAVVNGNKEKVKKIFGNKFEKIIKEENFDTKSIQLFLYGYQEVPEDIIIKMTIDPLNKFNDYDLNSIYDMLGTLPYWAINPKYLDKPLKEALDNQYGFGLYESTGQTITEDGIYKYPKDPDSYPLIKIERKDETFYQYLHAIISIVQKDGSNFSSRMD